MALQEMGRRTDEDVALITNQGHTVFISSGQVDGSFATGIAIHSHLADYIYHVSHHARFMTATLRLAQGPRASRVKLKLISVHIPSSINAQD